MVFGSQIGAMETANCELLDKRPGILMIGSPNVGKRTLLSRLVSQDVEATSDDSLLQTFVYGWTIKTKYYAADVALWIAHLHDGISVQNLSKYEGMAALVMVFNMNEPATFAALKEWVSQTNIQQFEVLLCVGNKVDLLPSHPAHVEYKRRLFKINESSGTFSADMDYGISETEGSSLLGDEEDLTLEIKRSCFDWCIENNIEFVEACGSNADFDKCLSMDGDLQGVERIFGALSAHMWPGMILKSGDKIDEPSLPDHGELSDEESDYELEYEILSAGSADGWTDTEVEWMSASADATTSGTSDSTEPTVNVKGFDAGGDSKVKMVVDESQLSTSTTQLESSGSEEARRINHDSSNKSLEPDNGDNAYNFADLEQLMSEIGSARSSLRLLPDFQRREMAANLAMKMAQMFGDISGDEGDEL